MSTDDPADNGWYVPPTQGGLQPASLEAENPTGAAIPRTSPGSAPLAVQGGMTDYGAPGAGGYGAPIDYGNGGYGAPTDYGVAPWDARVQAPLAAPVSRLGALLLDGVLAVVTLFIGWAIWSLVVWGRGTTPGKSLMRQRVVDAKTGQTATWGHMAVRQLLVGGLLAGVLNSFTFTIYSIVDACMVFTDGHRRLTDRIAQTLVVQD